MDRYLKSTEVIDWEHPDVLAKAESLKSKDGDELETVKNCFEFVRDGIRHIMDFRLNPVTLKASDVLKHETGYCFSKSHLLAALLRANSVRAGFSYQRLLANGRFCLHGLNSVYLEKYGWLRLDARGDNGTVSTSFAPPAESLAFIPSHSGEADFPEIWDEPLPIVRDFLSTYTDREESLLHIPDIRIS